MFEILMYLFIFIILAGAGVVGYVFLQSHLSGSSLKGAFFAPKPEKRLDVVEQWSLDARRKLVLIRRDNVEHLIMTGGPVDVVIETGIGEKRKGLAVDPVEAVPVYSRPARGVGTAPLPANATAPQVNGTQAGKPGA